MKLTAGAEIRNGHLVIGGIDSEDLIAEYGTPLMVYDETEVRNQCRRYVKTAAEKGIRFHPAYASKAFLCVYMAEIMKEEGFGLDVVSAGELYTALKAGVDPKHIHMHGNNKTPAEIRYALESGIGTLVIDSLQEIARIEKIASGMNVTADCLLRVTPGIEAHTHDFIDTGRTDSKFGMNLDNGQAEEGLQKILSCGRINLRGVHFHIGSQILGPDGHIAAVRRTVNWLAEMKRKYGYEAEVLNIGGGFGIPYTETDADYPVEEAFAKVIDAMREAVQEAGLREPELWAEPGRSIAGRAGYTFYTAGTKKEIPGIRTYLSVDGGMADNIRPALYDAKYACDLSARMNDEKTETVTVCGKYCESGDILIRDAVLPEAEEDDHLVVYCTGAYHYTMSSNYNGAGRPAVVFVKDGKAVTAIRRETPEDLIRNQI